MATLMGVAPDDADMSAYNLTLHSVTMLTPMWKGLTAQLKQQAEIIRKALALAAEGKLTIRHAESFALADAGKAHAFLENGKVTLRIGA